jgi:hypothetical protein
VKNHPLFVYPQADVNPMPIQLEWIEKGASLYLSTIDYACYFRILGRSVEMISFSFPPQKGRGIKLDIGRN